MANSAQISTSIGAITKAFAIPRTDHRSHDELPFIEFMPGVELQLLQADVAAALWVVRVRFQPGVTIPAHRHTGEVFAMTASGSWNYLEYPDVNNVAGSYLYERAGSVHTLHVPATNTEVTEAWFAVRGANLNLGENGEVASVWDAGYMRDLYLEKCREAGFPDPPVIGLDSKTIV